MRKSVSIPIIVVIAFCVWLLLEHKSQLSPNLAVVHSEPSQPAVEPPPTNNSDSMGMATNMATAAVAITPSPTPVTNNAPLLNLLGAHNLDEWKAAVTNLGQTTSTSWVKDQFPTVPPMKFVIGSIPFNSDAVSIFTKDNSSYVRSIEIQSLVLSAADTRALGDSLLGMMGKDNADFNAWCDKAGNNYGYSPLYSSGGTRLPNGKYYGFGILCGFNSVKPWIINFFITDP